MRKSVFFIAASFILISAAVFGQKKDTYRCFNYDLETDTAGFETVVIDSNTNCLEITGAISEKTLENIFSKVTAKEKIIRISISNYPEKSIPSGIKNFSNLTGISIINCPDLRFREFFNQLKHLKNLTCLELDDNERAEIPPNIKSLGNLKILSIKNYDYVDANKLFKSLTRLPSLTALTIASVGKIELDKNADFPKWLKSLDMSDNWLSFLPNDISKASQLQSLDISENNFADAEAVMHLVENLPLKTLSITCYNRMDSLAVVKTFPAISLQVAIYHQFQRNNATINNLKNGDEIPVVSNFYSKTLKPPIGNPEIIRKKFNIDAQQHNTLLYQTGTKINIPEAAFVDSRGNTVKGDVIVYYREYNDILDIFANGVPMNYDSAGQKYAFRTAGMFEIYALKDNKLVFMAPGKTIAFDFATVDTGNGYSLYRLNENTGKWDFKTPLQSNFTVKEEKFSAAYKMYSKLLAVSFDTTHFEDRYKDTLYARTKKIPYEYFNGKKKLLDTYFKLKKVYNYNKNKDIKKMPNFYMEVDNYAPFKELNAYRGWVWVYSGPLTKKEFSKQYVTRKKWTDTRISYIPSENMYNIELKSPHEFGSFDAFPVRSNYTTETSKYEKTHLRLDNRYNKILKKIQVKFDKNIDKKKAKVQKQNWDMICKNMSPEEKAMTKEEWLAYAKKRMIAEKDSLNKAQYSYANVTRSFEIDGFGIWNCDQMFRLKNPMELNAQFKDAFDKTISPSTVNVIDGSSKGILSYNMVPGAKIAIDPTSETALFLIGTNGSVSIVDKESVRNTISSQKTNRDFTFTCYEIDPGMLSTGELRKLLGFE